MNLKPDLYTFLSNESPRELKRLIGLSIFSGLLNTSIIALINAGSKDVSNGQSVTMMFFGFCALLMFFLFVTRRSNKENILNTQDLIYRFKVRIMRDVYKSSLTKIDQIGRQHITEVLLRDTQLVSHTVVTVVSTFQSFTTLIFLIIYMATVSMTAFFIILLSSVLIIVFGVMEAFRSQYQMQSVAQKESEVNAYYADFLNGYKEIKMNSHRSFDLTLEMVNESKSVKDLKSDFFVSSTNFFSYLQIVLYVVVGMMVFIIPLVSPDFAKHVPTAATTTLFLAGTLGGLITSVPGLSEANISAKRLMDLTADLEAHDIKPPILRQEDFSDVRSISLHDVTYQHSTVSEKNKFQLGPLSYQFDAGKVYFIRGSNGSGKTTLIRILTGLYQPSSGEVRVNGKSISEPSSLDYRDIFAVVFSDFYLFKKLYGIEPPKPEEIDQLLERFQMQGKVSIQNNTFSDLQFSTGQRKRIGLIVALLEKKQFIILDEWAADQDPAFRQEFYEQIIPQLRAMGKTVIAITHDDHYYDKADHVLYMFDGKPLIS